jgi:hypothetical protein
VETDAETETEAETDAEEEAETGVREAHRSDVSDLGYSELGNSLWGAVSRGDENGDHVRGNDGGDGSVGNKEPQGALAKRAATAAMAVEEDDDDEDDAAEEGEEKDCPHGIIPQATSIRSNGHGPRSTSSSDIAAAAAAALEVEEAAWASTAPQAPLQKRIAVFWGEDKDLTKEYRRGQPKGIGVEASKTAPWDAAAAAAALTAPQGGPLDGQIADGRVSLRG